MKALLLLASVFTLTIGLNARADVTLSDVEIVTKYMSIEVPADYTKRPGEFAAQGPVYKVRVHSCSRRSVEGLTVISQQKDLVGCFEVGSLPNLVAKNYSFSQSEQKFTDDASAVNVSVTGAIRKATLNRVAIDDVSFVVSLWEARSNGQDYFIAKKILNPLALKVRIGAYFTLTDATNGMKLTVSLYPSIPNIQSGYEEFNPPAPLFDEVVVESLTGKVAGDQTVADLMWLAIVYYMNPANPMYSILPLGDENSVEYREVKNLVTNVSRTDLRRGLVAYQTNYRKALAKVQAKLAVEQAEVQRQKQILEDRESKARARAAQQAQLEEANRIQQQIANAQAQQARIAKQRRDTENAKAAIGLGLLIAGALADSR